MVLLAGACSETVPLGSWDRAAASGGAASSSGGSASTGGVAAMGGVGDTDGGSNASGSSGEAGSGNLSCARGGGTSMVSTGTSEVGATLTNTDWSFAARSDAMEVDITVDAEPPPGGDGYFWAYQFSFVGSPSGYAGFVGLQVNGAFQDPDMTVTYKNRLAVFWIAGPPLNAEPGDITDPQQIYMYSPMKFNVTWSAINVIYPWQACRTYRLRVGRQAVESNGDIWYGAWVTDLTTNVRTFIGRMLVSGAWGQLATSSSSWCDRIGWTQPTTCKAVNYASATWGIPWGLPNATAAPSNAYLGSRKADRFGGSGSPLRCPTSRITDFSDGVRHESGIAGL